MKKLKLIGTHHLMKKEEIERIIMKENPDIIGVELCKSRFYKLVLKKNIEVKQKFKQKFSLLGLISKKIKEKAEKEGLEYGGDMISASNYARKNNIPLSLVDEDILKIHKSIKKIPFKEKIGFFLLLFQLSGVKLKDASNRMNELDASKFVNELKISYPIAYKILVEDREKFIYKKIIKLVKEYPDKQILIFLGYGHIKGINKLLNKKNKLNIQSKGGKTK